MAEPEQYTQRLLRVTADSDVAPAVEEDKTMSPTASPPAPELRAWRIADPGVRAALCNAPLGRHPLLEAAYAWHERQRHRTAAPRHRQTPVISAEIDGVAERLARLLSPVAWAIVVEADESGRRTHGNRQWVLVQADVYHRVARTLNAAWRDRWNLLDPGRSGPAEARSAALALWRMAILTGGYQQPDGALAVQARTLAGVHALTQTARRLQFTTTSGFGQNPTTMVIRDPARISALLAAAAT